ncbi:MAG TPA: hypothetical protein VHB54_09450 [Mucilaginibacter sp.]|nr:hypothetical protein [Mucilaginibacter sp.]
MNILVAKSKALQMLTDRLSELNAINPDNYKGWKSRTNAEIKSIFAASDDRHYEFSRIVFDLVGMRNVEVFFKGQNEASQLLKSYISFIKDNIAEAVVEKPRDYELEFKRQEAISHELKQQISRYENHMRRADASLQSCDNEIATLKSRIEQLENNIFQTENINALRLWTLAVNLPGKLQLSLIAFLIIVGTAGYYIGSILKPILK